MIWLARTADVIKITRVENRQDSRKEQGMNQRITSPVQLRESRLAHFLFADPRASVLWLVVRLWVGYQWINAGYHKVTDPNGVWVGAKAGAGLTGFVNGALKLASGEHPSVQGWYADFLKSVVLPNATMFSYMVAFGECLVGIGLIVGGLTGVAAFFGVMMNTNFLLAGTVSTNPILAIPAVLLILAWRNAGWYGLDRWLLPIVGTPWQPGSVFEHDEKVAQSKL